MITLTTSSITFVNTNYILPKPKNAKELRISLRKFKVLIEKLFLSDKIVELALSDDKFSEFYEIIPRK